MYAHTHTRIHTHTHTRTHTYTQARQRAPYSRVAAFSGNAQQCNRSWLSYALHVVAGH